MEKALEGWNAEGKTILDIGAGTGILYDRLLAMDIKADYYACDISVAMLAQSSIPEDRRWAGTPPECDFPVQDFDAIFLLGVTTYLTPSELSGLLEYISSHLKPEGLALLSFTNRESIDFKLRRFVEPFLPRRFFRKRVLGKAVKIHGYSLSEVREILPGGLRLDTVRWLNATVFPISRVLPRLSVWMSKRLLRLHTPSWVPADFLVALRPE